MSTVGVKVSWQKQNFDVEVDTEQPAMVFKTQLFTLTGVPPERQKIMAKGKQIKDDSDLSKMGMKNGMKLMMMGSADAIPVAPTSAPVFIEDMTEAEQVKNSKRDYTAGLQNLGNTCYMNATLQCMNAIEPLRDGLKQFQGGTGLAAGDKQSQLTGALRDLLSDMDSSAEGVAPFRFLMVLRDMFPQFAEQGEQGGYKQQDAEECWGQILITLGSKIPSINRLFEIGYEMRLKCEESGEERVESYPGHALKCNITADVNYLQDGFKLGLEDSREIHSSALNRTAVFAGGSKITSLPDFLNVSMVRFFWRADTGKKAKIMRAVAFTVEIDVFDFCTDELKAKLRPARDRRREAQDAKAGIKKEEKIEEKKEGEDAEMATESDAAAGTSDAPSEPQHTGLYELFALVTHKGRYADAGHYVGWTKMKDGNWMCYDDDTLSIKTEEDILALRGGGDHHMAYIMLYRAIKA